MAQDKQEHPFLPLVAPARFDRNFLQQVVCELRFPTLFELNVGEPPQAFARAVRKSYPHHSHQVAEVSVDGSAVDRMHTHIFKSKNLDWTVTLRSSAITIETSKYTSFADFAARLGLLLDIAPGIIDSDFFTRVGLRYINAVPMTMEQGNTKQFRGWIRDGLVEPLIEENLGVLDEYSGRMHGKASFGGFLFQHGVGYNQGSKKPEYMLDFDFSRENVELEDIVGTLEVLHQNQFSMFMWALGPLAIEHLGPSVLKEYKDV